MKILYHHRTLADGAEGIHIREMVDAFRSLGNEVLVVALVGETSQADAAKQKAWSRLTSLIPAAAYELAELSYNVVGRRNAALAIRKFKPDLIYDRYNSYSTAAVDAARASNIPLILEVNAPVAYERNAYENHPLRFPRLAIRYEKRILAAADHIFAVSTPLKDFLIDQRHVSPDQVSVLPNGANPESFKPGVDGGAVRSRHGIDASFVIGFVGILRPWHGLDLLLQAFSQLLANGIDGCLLIVGDGPMEATLKQQARELGIERRVVFTGRVRHEQMAEYISAMDVAVSPRATFYASPMKIIEYMAMAVPTVAPRMPNIEDIISDGVDGILYTPEDVGALYCALRTVATDRKLQQCLATNARAKVEQSLNWVNNAKVVLERARRLGCGNGSYHEKMVGGAVP